MTEQPRCERCGRPIHDQSYVDDHCARELAKSLRLVATLAGEAATTIARLDAIGAGGRRADTEVPLPVNLAAAEAHDAAVNAILTWSKHVWEQRGFPPDLGSGHPLAVLADWLAGELDWLRHRREASEAFDELMSACHTIERVVDRPAQRWYMGVCGVDGCEEELHPVTGASTFRCRCGVQHDVAERKAQLLDLAADEWLTAAWCAHLLTSLGVACTASVVSGYAFRGKLAPWPDSKPARYRLGSVRELVQAQYDEERERTLRAAVRAAELAERRRKREKATV